MFEVSQAELSTLFPLIGIQVIRPKLAPDWLKRYLNQILFLALTNPFHLSKKKKKKTGYRERMQSVLITKSLKKNMLILAEEVLLLMPWW